MNDWTAFKDIMLYAPLNTALPTVPTPPTAPTLGIGSLADIIKRTQQINERIRNHTGYTVAIGQDLGIIGAEIPPHTKPENVKAKALPGNDVRISYGKNGSAGVVVFSKRAAETLWSQLSIDTNTPYVDTREPLVAGQPETRAYRLQLFDGDAPTGDYSDEVSVVTVP